MLKHLPQDLQNLLALGGKGVADFVELALGMDQTVTPDQGLFISGIAGEGV
jgi:hypothetical protein